MSRSFGKFPKKPDIFFRTNWYAIIIDIAIVDDPNINKGYIHKLNAYKELANQLREKLKLTKIKIVPVIATINGLVNKQTVADLKEIDIKINWKKILKDIKIERQ